MERRRGIIVHYNEQDHFGLIQTDTPATSVSGEGIVWALDYTDLEYGDQVEFELVRTSRSIPTAINVRRVD